ncbi:MAG: ZIP family metal transporter [Peptococcaceae bacterium]|jgi:ZIP family zinc transporter|nr:ZIP family metal transporter [Peptococcaceae bacterium]
MFLDHNSFFYLLYISTIAGLATTFGCLIVLFLGNPPEKLLATLLAAAGGVMLSVVLLDLIPVALSYNRPWQFLAGFAVGSLFMFTADKFLQYKNNKNAKTRRAQLKRIGLLVASGIALHDIPEGMAIAVGQESTAHIGTVIALGIALHNLPEGMATATPLLMAGIRKSKILSLTFGIAFFTPLGAILGKIALNLVHGSLCFFVSLAAGAMTFLVLGELLPLAKERYPGWALFGAVSGFIFFLLIVLFLPH